MGEGYNLGPGVRSGNVNGAVLGCVREGLPGLRSVGTAPFRGKGYKLSLLLN